jgi:hypothetical protein
MSKTLEGMPLISNQILLEGRKTLHLEAGIVYVK